MLGKPCELLTQALSSPLSSFCLLLLIKFFKISQKLYIFFKGKVSEGDRLVLKVQTGNKKQQFLRLKPERDLGEQGDLLPNIHLQIPL